MCHVAGIGVMAKIFVGKENSDNVLTLLLVKECHWTLLLSRRRTKKELLAEQLLSRIDSLPCMQMCSLCILAIFLKLAASHIVSDGPGPDPRIMA